MCFRFSPSLFFLPGTHSSFFSLADALFLLPLPLPPLLSPSSLLSPFFPFTLDPSTSIPFFPAQDNIGPQTVTEFFDAAVTYGIPALRQECFSWLLKNLMTSPAEFMAGISEELMTELVDNADLFVMQVSGRGGVGRNWISFNLPLTLTITSAYEW